MRNFLSILFGSNNSKKKNNSSLPLIKPQLLTLEARITPIAQPIIAGQGTLNDFTAIGADSGGGPLVTVTFPANPITGATAGYVSFFAYDAAFTGGVRVALGDINNDGTPEVITAAGPTGAPHIKVFQLDVLNQTVVQRPISQFYAFNEQRFTGGIYVACADTNADGFKDIIVGAGAGGGPRVAVYAGSATGVVASPINDFFAYPVKNNTGVVVTGGQRNTNAGAEVIVAPASNGGYNIKSFDVNGKGSNPTLVDNFFAFNDFKSRGGLSIAAGDLDNGQGTNDLVVGTTNGQFGVILNDQSAGIPVTAFPNFNGAIRAGVATDGTGQTVAVALAGPTGGPRVSIFNFQTSGLVEVESALVVKRTFQGGLFGATTL